MVEAGKNGLYRSDDGGMKWELVNSDARWVTNRPFISGHPGRYEE